MSTNFFKPETILSGNEQWIQLEEKWGEPVDLETDEGSSSRLQPVLSTSNLMKTTFDSSFLFKKVTRKVGRQLSKCGVLDYNESLEASSLPKQSYFVKGQIISARSVAEICDKIDDIFKSVEKLCSATSTICKKEVSHVICCSISVDNLSFDDTASVKQNTKESLDKYIDEAFENFGHLSKIPIDDHATKKSVNTLIRKFSSILSSPTINCNPGRQRQRCNNFKELVEFWESNAFNE